MGPEPLSDNRALQCGFWASRCGPGTKRALLGALVACFVSQTLLVYFDPSRSGALSEQAKEGRWIWHQYNCQSCHQLYGFGGFLGPDLTNASSRVAPQRLERLLTEGSGRMPAFGLSPHEVAAVTEFLDAMDKTGQGQARIRVRESDGEGPARRLIRAIQDEIAEAGDENAKNGFNLFMVRGCQGCHISLRHTLTGAPDVLTVRNRLNGTQIMQVLENGHPPAMPPPGLSPQERAVMYEFLGWLGNHQYSLLRRSRAPADGEKFRAEVPWWEFR